MSYSIAKQADAAWSILDREPVIAPRHPDIPTVQRRGASSTDCKAVSARAQSRAVGSNRLFRSSTRAHARAKPCRRVEERRDSW